MLLVWSVRWSAAKKISRSEETAYPGGKGSIACTGGCGAGDLEEVLFLLGPVFIGLWWLEPDTALTGLADVDAVLVAAIGFTGRTVGWWVATISPAASALRGISPDEADAIGVSCRLPFARAVLIVGSLLLREERRVKGGATSLMLTRIPDSLITKSPDVAEDDPFGAFSSKTAWTSSTVTEQ